MQAVPKAKPKAKKTEEEKSQEELAMSWKDRAAAACPELLTDISAARTNALKLSGIVYAKDLADQLLSHATTLENLYKRIQAALESGGSEKSFQEIMSKVTSALPFTSQANTAAQAFLKKPSKKKAKAKAKAASGDNGSK